MSDTKIKFCFPNGTVMEIEGTESFVEKHWTELKDLFKKEHVSASSLPTTSQINRINPTAKTSGKKDRKPITPKPLSIDLKGHEDIPSLKQFIAEKIPNGEQEKITSFVYYLNKYCNIPDVELGHIVSCYNELNSKIPNVYSVCLNITNRKGWIESGSKSYSHKITRLGENFIGHDLPRKKLDNKSDLKSV